MWWGSSSAVEPNLPLCINDAAMKVFYTCEYEDTSLIYNRESSIVLQNTDFIMNYINLIFVTQKLSDIGSIKFIALTIRHIR